MNPINRITGREENDLWPDEYVWTCSLCPEMAHGSRKYVESRLAEHRTISHHDIGFIRYPHYKTVRKKATK